MHFLNSYTGKFCVIQDTGPWHRIFARLYFPTEVLPALPCVFARSCITEKNKALHLQLSHTM